MPIPSEELGGPIKHKISVPVFVSVFVFVFASIFVSIFVSVFVPAFVSAFVTVFVSESADTNSQAAPIKYQISTFKMFIV